jgi:hypothetical protein
LFELAIALTYSTAVLMIAVKCFIIAGPWLKEIKKIQSCKSFVCRGWPSRFGFA